MNATQAAHSGKGCFNLKAELFYYKFNCKFLKKKAQRKRQYLNDIQTRQSNICTYLVQF